ncbi:hypothetical protein A0H81_10148 [Grifola frondosa]|uniref:Uncharacterized protein n=1 Tax=Grifola frondosa TaxID=5627 RepID=A0A1C7LY07_GRIFR|nr:hypothetical protein A0H81_10148 [Grifola frondosa]
MHLSEFALRSSDTTRGSDGAPWTDTVGVAMCRYGIRAITAASVPASTAAGIKAATPPHVGTPELLPRVLRFARATQPRVLLHLRNRAVDIGYISNQPNAPLPDDPLARFPPPLPAQRRTLRESRGVTLQIKTTAPYAAICGPWSPKGHVQPHRSHLPRRRNKHCFSVRDEKRADDRLAEATKAEAPAVQTKVPAPVMQSEPPKLEENHRQELIPGLELAFAGENIVPPECNFTHILDICYASGGHTPAAESFDGRAQRLRLTISESARRNDPAQRADLALTDAQLCAARDFIAQALPYSMAANETEASTPVETVLHYIDEEENFESVWKGEVSEEEVEKVERIARKWSWMSSIMEQQRRLA